MTTETLELYIRPSAMRQLDLCPGAAQAQAEVDRLLGRMSVDEEDEGVAKLGNDCHRVMADAIRDLQTDEAMRADLEDGIERHALDRWSSGCCRLALQYFEHVCQSRFQRQVDDVLVEQYFSGDAAGISRGGTADVVIIWDDGLVTVIDWKFGFLEQDPADINDQLATYAAIIAAHFKASRVQVHVYQPRMEPERRASVAEFDANALRDAAAWGRSVTDAARRPSPITMAGRKQCQYCRALPYCQTARRYIEESRAMFEVQIPTTPDELGEALDAARVAEQFADAVKKMARPKITADPGAAAGWHLAPSGAMTTIDAPACMDAAMSTGRLPELLPFISLKAEAARALPWVGEFTSKKEKAPSLKPLPGRE